MGRLARRGAIFMPILAHVQVAGDERSVHAVEVQGCEARQRSGQARVKASFGDETTSSVLDFSHV